MIKELKKECSPKPVDAEWIKTQLELTLKEHGDGSSELIIGQKRAEKALQFGLSIDSQGFNIYVAGSTKTSKLNSVRSFLQERARKESTPLGWCYVNNFEDANHPKKLSLPSLKALSLKSDMKRIIAEAQSSLAKVFESEEYAKRRKEVSDALEQKLNEIFEVQRVKLREQNWELNRGPLGFFAVPIKKGKPITDEKFRELSPDQQKELRTKQKEFQDELNLMLREVRKLEKKAEEDIHKLDKEVSLFAIHPLIEEIENEYKSYPDVLHYLKEVEQDIQANLPEFIGPQKQQGFPFIQMDEKAGKSFFVRYEVNVLATNSHVGAPVIMELNPTYNNLFGRIEKESYMGSLTTNFTLIREGALHRANGGYLIIPVEELFRNVFSWDALKRALRNKEIVIEDPNDQFGFFTTRSLKPQAIPLHTKVLLIGDSRIYHLLLELDPDFRKLFKVKADFDAVMDRTEENTSQFIALIGSMGKTEQLINPDVSAMARIIEHASRLASDQEKLSTQFDEILDVMREASFYAQQEQSGQIASIHVRKAIDEKYFRSNLLQEKISEMVNKNLILLNLKGEKKGQVNGLSVIDLGDISFGRPNRITCSVSLGREGIIAIEREAALSGPIHTKGVLILSGYLAEKFFQHKPISLTARLVFEQSYSEVEGDSASSAELYTLLSDLSGLAIKQAIAVTGSVNQKGEIQPIGGVNEKIEGYFEACKSNGFNNEQGIIIPQGNVKHLVLKEELTDHINQGHFHIWAIDSIDEGIEILTGVKSGKPDQDGAFEEGTVSFLVNQRLSDFAKTMKEYSFVEEHKKELPHVQVQESFKK